MQKSSLDSLAKTAKFVSFSVVFERERERERDRERDWDPEGGKRETETETHRLPFGGNKKRGRRRRRRRELDCVLVGERGVGFFALDFWLGSFAFSRAF